MDHAVNWEAISAIGQIVGALAVVISLIYVAREVRSSAHATRSSFDAFAVGQTSGLNNSQSSRI
jgi:hypothetical protein